MKILDLGLAQVAGAVGIVAGTPPYAAPEQWQPGPTDARVDVHAWGQRCTQRGQQVVLTGGGALIQGLDDYLREETGLSLAMAEDPLSSVVLGAGKMLSDFNLLRKIAID